MTHLRIMHIGIPFTTHNGDDRPHNYAHRYPLHYTHRYPFTIHIGTPSLTHRYPLQYTHRYPLQYTHRYPLHYTQRGWHTSELCTSVPPSHVFENIFCTKHNDARCGRKKCNELEAKQILAVSNGVANAETFRKHDAMLDIQNMIRQSTNCELRSLPHSGFNAHSKCLDEIQLCAL
jgi:hypothetical protein